MQPGNRGLTGLCNGLYNPGETPGGSRAFRPSPDFPSGMTVTLNRMTRLALSERIRCTESARCAFSSPQIPSSREDVPMPHNRRGLLFAGVAALALLVAGARPARAQDAVVRGRITSDRGEPIPGANVVIDELRLGVITTATGQYTLSVPGARVRGQPVVVRVRAIGFKPNSKAITLTAGEQVVDLALGYDVNLLEANVVTGTQEATEAVKGPVTVNRVDASQLPVPASNPLTQLQGKVPGANIVSASGRPGAQPAVLLRGPTSINASGRGQDPLYIVDGDRKSTV